MSGMMDSRRYAACYLEDADEQPPITLASLAELDMPEIINSPKLRHDVNFDRELHFRPNLDGSKEKQKMLQAGRYWASLEAEVWIQTKLLLRKTAANESHCAPVAPPPMLWIPKFFANVRDILVSLVPDYDQEEVKQRLNEQIEDPVLDLCELAAWLAKVLKNHCAPMRDGTIDEMARKVNEGVTKNKPSNIVDGFRLMLAILEAMKLDVANHQIRQMRPLLIEDAIGFQRRYNARGIAISRQGLNEARLESWCQEREMHNEHTPQSRTERYPGLILQPDSSPISQEELGAEVKGIYAGLVMAEAKRINIDAAQAASSASSEPFRADQWQALIALHRTLLYEHHDFLRATQHPSATPESQRLAANSMPARLWKHGIHAFLQVLRQRQPESQEYMLAFIYLTYQMMASLFETVPAFTDTWIECLGDLARYRMAMEESPSLDDVEPLRTPLCNIVCEGIPDNRLSPGVRISLADFQNLLADVHCEPNDAHLPISVDQDNTRPLSEDFMIRGLIWAQFYFCPGWFDDLTEEDEVLPEPSSTLDSRAERILWLGLYLAFSREQLHYDVQSKIFYTSRGATPEISNLRHEDDFTHPTGSRPDHLRDGSMTATRLYSYVKRLLKIPNRLLQSLVSLHFAKCAFAAPTGFPASNQTSPPTTAPAHDTFIQWTGSIEHKTLLIATWITALGGLANITHIAIRKAKTEPKMSGDLAIGFSLAAWVLVETAPSLTSPRTALVTLWFAAESDYIARMCCVVKNGRVYFWASVMFGLFMAMFMAALQSDARPTLASMLLTGLPSAAFFVSCAARVLPRAVSEPPAAGGQ